MIPRPHPLVAVLLLTAFALPASAAADPASPHAPSHALAAAHATLRTAAESRATLRAAAASRPALRAAPFASPSGSAPDTAWQPCGVPISVGPGERAAMAAVPDRDGGAYVVWQRLKPVTFESDIYAQHVDVNGHLVTGWPAAGLPICSALREQTDLVAIPDGFGGCIVAWDDTRNDPSSQGNSDVYAIRIGADGAPAAGWTADGVQLTASLTGQTLPAITSDSLGGAFVAWQEPAAGGGDDGAIVVQHVLGNGSLDSGWPANGLILSTGTGPRGDPTAVADAAGGCIVAWDDARSANLDIYAQRVTDTGTVLWTANGALACGGTREQVSPRGISDGSGGMLMILEELDSGDFNSIDITAQHIDGNGALVSGWASNGVTLCAAASAQIDHHIASDGLHGAFASWDDFRFFPTRVYVQHVEAGGTIASGFDPDGNRVSTGTADEYESTLLDDGTGGALVTWTEGASAVFLQRMTGAGVPAPNWGADGVTLCPTETQSSPILAPDGQHGAIVAHLDDRGGLAPELYASHVTLDASVPVQLSLVSAEADPDEVRLRWFGAPAGAPYRLLRSRGDESWTSLATLIADGTGLIRFTDRDVAPGDRLTYRLTSPGGEPNPLTADAIVQVPGFEESAPRLTPNPSAGLLAVSFSLARASEVRWTMVDVAGRRVAGGDLGRLPAGAHRPALAGTRALPAGVYTLQLARDGRVISARACVVR